MISIAHKIELVPNNKQKTYFRKAFGVTRFAYNWGIAEWQRRYKEGEKCSFIELNNAFNAIKGEQYPFVLEVTKWAPAQALRNVAEAYKRFFKDLKKGIVSYPKFKKKKDNYGKFYLADIKLSETNENLKRIKGIISNKNLKRQYLFIPKLGYVKMSQRVRFYGKIKNVVISQEGNKFFASFCMQITDEEYKRTHPHSLLKKKGKVGIDLGIKSALILSDGIAIENPKSLKNNLRKIKKISRQLSKREHARTKLERMEGKKKSNNYKRLSVKLSNTHCKVANARRDFIQKVTTILSSHYAQIALEDLNVKGMMRNNRLVQSILDVSFGELIRQIEYKSALNGGFVKKADRFYPSSKTCSVCGNIKEGLELHERTYRCNKCNAVIDRDYNASLNLLKLLSNNKIGVGNPKFTPVDLTALLYRFETNGIVTSKVESGRQQILKS